MPQKILKRNSTLLVILGNIFWVHSLFWEIIAALVNLLSLSIEQVSDDDGRKNTKVVNQKLEEVTSNLKNTEDMLLKVKQN